MNRVLNSKEKARLTTASILSFILSALGLLII